MPQKIVIASHNAHKVQEIVYLLGEEYWQVLSLRDFPEIGDIEETGVTFEENALIKARAVYARTKLLTISDDSGLEVDHLGGAPGVYSARFAGEAKSDSANNRKLLQALNGVAEARRGAQFRCVAAIISNDYEKVVEGIVRGKIADGLSGSGGFGYDPLFIPDGYQRTFGEFGPVDKHKISHRGLAFIKAKQVIMADFFTDR